MICFYLVVHPEHHIVRGDFLKLEKFEQGLEEAQHVAVWSGPTLRPVGSV